MKEVCISNKVPGDADAVPILGSDKAQSPLPSYFLHD